MDDSEVLQQEDQINLLKEQVAEMKIHYDKMRKYAL